MEVAKKAPEGSVVVAMISDTGEPGSHFFRLAQVTEVPGFDGMKFGSIGLGLWADWNLQWERELSLLGSESLEDKGLFFWGGNGSLLHGPSGSLRHVLQG